MSPVLINISAKQLSADANKNDNSTNVGEIKE